MYDVVDMDYTQQLEEIITKLDSMDNSVVIDYSQQLEDILIKLVSIENALHLIITFLFVFAIVIVCKFAYRQFNIFFK